SRPSDAAMAALMRHPRFAEAIRIVAAGIVTLYRNNPKFNQVLPDRGRFLISVFALHLHFGAEPDNPRSGLTVSRMRALCAKQKVCSPGRAEAALMLMRRFGYLAPAPDETDRRLRRLVPTERLIELHRARCAFIFEATAKLLPEGADALAALRSPQ